jgi:serine phosphatase RsbU (regulator of sigma subunit)
VDRAARLIAAVPAAVLVAVGAADLLLGEGNIVLGLVVIAPLLASNVTGPRATAAYAVAALLLAALLGIADDQYTEHSWAAQLIRLVAVAAGGVAAVFASRYRVQREHRLAAMTRVADVAQHAILLPVPSPLAGVEIAVHYESAASDAVIGGDLYGAVVTRQGLRVIVADVRGKGLDAVRVAAQVLAAFRERATEDEPLPVLADHLDATVRRIGDPEDFVTGVIAQLLPGGAVSLVNAGHPPPMLARAGDVSLVVSEDPCPPFGLFLGTPVAQHAALGSSGRLLLYTDGLIEARRPTDRAFLPHQAIADRLAVSTSVSEDIAGLLDLLTSWIGGAPSDDVALMSLQTLVPAPAGAPTSARRASALPPD